MGKPHRIDPPDCGCTDCITGWSEPYADNDGARLAWQAKRIAKGKASNATGMIVKKSYSFDYPEIDWNI